MAPGKLALLFPGHGAHDPHMLDGLVASKKFDDYYSSIVDAVGYSPIEAMKRDPSLVNSHLLSTLLTFLASALSYLRFKEVENVEPDYLAGYSIGQFTALYAAGCYDFAHLVEIIRVRSSLIDKCTAGQPGAMLGVVGLMLDPVKDVVARLADNGQRIWISNFNCTGQYTLSGTREAIRAAFEILAPMKPKRLIELPVAGAWHCPLLEDAQSEIYRHLLSCDWQAPAIPVIDNVTGEFLPQSVDEIKEQVRKQVTHPVLWDKGIKTLIASGCGRFVEIGHGNVLTKFGFFIDRNAEFTSFYGAERLAETAG